MFVCMHLYPHAHAHFCACIRRICVYRQTDTRWRKYECAVIPCCIQIRFSRFPRHARFGALPDDREGGVFSSNMIIALSLSLFLHTPTVKEKKNWCMQLVFVTLFSAKWLNCQSPYNYLRGAGNGIASKRLMREYWICTSIRVFIKCGLHKDSRATALTQLPLCTMVGGTAGRRGGQWRHRGEGGRWWKGT